MKKIFLLFILFSLTVFSKNYSDLEKKDILQQYKKFQQAVKAKNEKEILKYIDFPVKTYETSGEKKTVTQLEFFASGYLDYLDMPEIDTKKLELKPVLDYLLSAEDDDWGNEYMSINGMFINSESEDLPEIFENLDGFVIYINYYNDVTEGGVYYLFDLVNGKLKLKLLYFLYS